MPRRLTALAIVALGLVVLAQVPAALSQAALSQETKELTLTITVPQTNATLSIDGKVTKASGTTREFKTPALDVKGTYKYEIKVLWEPNNYTKITRTKIIKLEPAKASSIKVDMTVPDPNIKDDIVVRYVPTPDKVVDAMCVLGKVTKDDIVYDLGCGDGRMVIRAVQKFGAKRGVGIDIDEERVKDSKANAAKAGVEKKVEFRKGDVLKVDDIPDATVVLLYMGNDINLRLRPILQSKLKPGSRIVSHRFTMGDWTPAKTEKLNVDGEDFEIHLWVVGDKKKK